jgi:pseudaminic acid synthase
MKRDLSLARLGSNSRPFIIAEMSGNHNGDIDRAHAIIDAAASAGVDAVKLQTATAEGLTLDVDAPEFCIQDVNSPWHGRRLHELYQEAVTPWAWHEELFAHIREVGLVALSTPFEEDAVDFLEQLDTPCYKIASFENADLPLIRKVAATGKPVIMSTGMASIAELDEAVRTLREGGCDDIVLLKCTSTYPASPENSNLHTIPHLRDLFGCEVGLSDHTHGIGVGVAAVALGATVIEKHFTLSRADGGVDSAFSMEPAEMAALVAETERAWQALGGVQYGPTEAEKPSMRFRRSLYIAQDVKAGDVLTRDNLRIIRPGLGLAPKYFDTLLGRRVNQDLSMGTAMRWDYLG